MNRYRSKPSEVEAVQWRGDNVHEIEDFEAPVRWLAGYADDDVIGMELSVDKDGALGWQEIPVGHWIVRQPGDLTDHWPVGPDYFASKYESVDVTPRDRPGFDS